LMMRNRQLEGPRLSGWKLLQIGNSCLAHMVSPLKKFESDELL
jgi:hypothetical protein